MPVAGSVGNGCASRPIFSLGSEKAASAIFSGLNKRASRNSESLAPDAASTTRPRTSTDRLYSHTSPGLCASGAFASRSTSSAGVTPRDSYGKSAWKTPALEYASLTGAFAVISP